jgi:MoaA/NifB/PqqE/SkfB family radical SAM enzyme
MSLASNLGLRKQLNIVGQFFHNRLAGRPTAVTIEITKRCNATCDFCPYWEADEVEEVKDFTPAIKYFKPIWVSITGGEPLLRKDVVEIARKIRDLPGFRFISIYSNGWLLNERLVGELTEAGVSNIQVSCNFPDERQDQERGIPGLYKKISTFMPEMVRKGYGANLTVGTFLCQENLDSVIDLAHVVRGWGINHSFSSYSRLKNDNHAHELPAEYIPKARKVVEELVNLRRTHKNILVSEEYLQTIPEFSAKGQLPGCTAGDKFIYIDQQGYIKQCPELPAVAHISKLEEYQSEAVSCGLCWYACRGEHQSSISPRRVREWLE